MWGREKYVFPGSYMFQEEKGRACTEHAQFNLPKFTHHRCIGHSTFPGLECVKEGKMFRSIREIEAKRLRSFNKLTKINLNEWKIRIGKIPLENSYIFM